MTNTLPAFMAQALTLADQYKYLLVFLLTIIEGPILMVAAGFLLHQGFFSARELFLVLLAGDLLGDVIWYYIGYFFAEPVIRKHGHFVGVSPEGFEKAKELFRRYQKKILFISKITIGFGMALATLMAAGATRVKIRTFLILNILGELILVTLLLTIGYLFGNVYGYVADGLKIGFIIGAIAVVGLVIYGFMIFMKHKIAGV